MIARPQDVARIPLSAGLACGPETWDRLVAYAPVPSPFMRWAWHRAWVDTARPDEARAAFVMALYGPQRTIQALVPFGLHAQRFRHVPVTALQWLIGSVGCPDHLDIPAVPDAAFDEMIQAIEELPWNVVVLRHVAEDAPGVARLSDALRRRGHAVRRTPVEWCPYLDLPGDWETYLSSLSTTRRQAIRRKERTLRRDHVVSVTDYAPDRLNEGWDRLRALHEQRWGDAGAFADRRLDELLRRFASDLAARGELWLNTLDVDGEPVAAWYGFAWRETVYFYQGGRDPRWNAHSVGSVLMGLMIRRAIERGFRRMDFLRGQEPYKLTWTATQRPNYEVAVFRRGWRGTVLRGLDLAARARANLRRPRDSSAES